MHKVSFHYNQSISKSHLTCPPSSKSIGPPSSKSIRAPLSMKSLLRLFEFPSKIKKKAPIFLILDLKHEGIFLFVFKYIILRVYVISLFGLVYSYILSRGFDYLPYICFDDDFKVELYSKGLCFCKDLLSKVMTYFRRNLLIVNLLAFCNLEVLNVTRKVNPTIYSILYMTAHGIGLMIHLLFPANWQYFFVSSVTLFMIFGFFFVISHLFFLKTPQRRDFNIQFIGIFITYLLNYLIYCFLYATNIDALRLFFFSNQLGIMVFVIIFHLLMIYISSSRDVLVEKCKFKGFVKESIITTTNCIFSYTKMGFFLALDMNNISFYFNVICLLFSNTTHCINFFKKKLFFLFKCHKCKFFKKLGFWKICLKSSLDKKLINGSFIFERFLNYYVLFYVYMSSKYFVDPLDAENYAKNCTLDLRDEFLIDNLKVLFYVFVDFLSIFVILTLNWVKNLDEIKYKTPESINRFKEMCLFMGVYYYSHYLFVLGYYIRYFEKNGD